MTTDADAPPGYSEVLKEQHPVPQGAFIQLQPVQYMVRVWMTIVTWLRVFIQGIIYNSPRPNHITLSHSYIPHYLFYIHNTHTHTHTHRTQMLWIMGSIVHHMII